MRKRLNFWKETLKVPHLEIEYSLLVSEEEKEKAIDFILEDNPLVNREDFIIAYFPAKVYLISNEMVDYKKWDEEARPEDIKGDIL